MPGLLCWALKEASVFLSRGAPPWIASACRLAPPVAFRRRLRQPCSKWHSRKRAVLWKPRRRRPKFRKRELIDFTFAELNRRVGRAGFSPGQRVFGRQLRLPSSLLEDDFIDPYMIAQDATHEMRRSEAMRMAAAHGCVVAADHRAMSTASHSRQRKPQRVPVAGEPVFIHRRKDGAQGWCGPGVCVLSEEPKPGRNETVWVHMRNCLHKCNRTQVRPATNEEAEGIETVTSLLPNLTEAVREGRTRHFADITDEGDPEDDEQMVVEGDVMDVRLGKPDSQPEPELNAPANCNAMEIGVGDRRVRFRDERDSSVIAGFDFEMREHSSDRGSMEEPRGKMPRRAETSESVVPLHSSEAGSSELQQVSTADASDNPTGAATLHEHDRGRTCGRLQNDDAT